MSSQSSQTKSKKSKRKSSSNNEALEAKRPRSFDEDEEIHTRQTETAGRITKIILRNIMCHDALEINLNKNVNFIVGKNGSGKSAILAGLQLGLGARAQTTTRATAVQGIIKDNRAKGIIEITLTNIGAMAYKREIYGDSITVVRTLGSVSGYKLKNALGHIISTKKSELDRIITCMNIQVDNPISVLNQEQAREFIATSNSSKKYTLFMKATQLDIIGENYRNALTLSYESKNHLDATKKQLDAEQEEIEILEKNLKILESIDESQQELDALQIELLWSFAIAEEEKLREHEFNLQQYEKNYEEQKSSQSDHGSKVEALNQQLDELKIAVQTSRSTSQAASDEYDTAKRAHGSKVDEISTKQREHRGMQNELKRLHQDLSMLTNEIQRLENGNSSAEQERNEKKQNLEKMQNELREVEAMLNTKITQQNHFESEKTYLESETRKKKMDIQAQNVKIQKMKSRLISLKQQSGDASTVFGRNIPRLLRRIDEEYNKKRFKEKPLGPLGAFIKMKDPSWTPAVESFLGYGLLNTFCVDNAQDARTLNNLTREIFTDGSVPNTICSKFHQRVHNVSSRKTSTNEYTNLLDAMEITNPIVANCLIDQREPECILMIPTSSDAKNIMGDRRNVPRNCRRALTKKADTFFPDPQYRCYSGKVATKAKWLQVSTREAILTLQEEIQNAENDLNRLTQDSNTDLAKLERNLTDYNDNHHKVMQLSGMKNKLKIKIEQIRDTITEETNDNCEVFKNEKIEKEKQIEALQNKEKNFRDEINQFSHELKQLEEEVHRNRQKLNDQNEKMNRLQEKIRELENEKRDLELNADHTKRRLEDANLKYKIAMTTVERQQKTTTEVVKRAEQAGPRIDTERSPSEINRLSKALQIRIKTVQEQFGSKEELQEELEQKRTKRKSVSDSFNIIAKTNTQHLTRVESRKKEFQTMKKMMASRVKQAFSNVLALRSYDGTINIDHGSKKLDIEVYPQNAKRKDANDVQTLSGGEKSYSTVAFILALWECTTLPFYFLDEFDVFMDKVNRRVVMDILIEHTKEHPERQFGFLTPLDASLVVANDYLTIHRLAAPERKGNTQES